jgi:hypothetical protein
VPLYPEYCCFSDTPDDLGHKLTEMDNARLRLGLITFIRFTALPWLFCAKLRPQFTVTAKLAFKKGQDEGGQRVPVPYLKRSPDSKSKNAQITSQIQGCRYPT